MFDPVLLRGRGDELAGNMISAMREMLLPQTTLLTPNTPEARRLAESATTKGSRMPPNVPVA